MAAITPESRRHPIAERPRRMRDSPVLISLLGGIETMGLPGLIVSPILVSLFVAVLHIYERENAFTMSTTAT